MNVPVLLTNRYARFKAEPELQLELKKFFRYHPAGYEDNPAYPVSWDGWEHLFRWSRVASSLFLLQRPKMENVLGCGFEVTDRRVYPSFAEESGLGAQERAWGHQKRALAAMVQASNGGGLVLSATGTGKTELAGLYFKRLKGAAVFIVDELFLLEQSRTALARVMKEEVGKVGEGEFNPKRVTVATIQTLDKHGIDREHQKMKPEFRAWYKTLDVAIIDEIHVALNERSLQIMQAINPKAVFGLTATLQMQELEIRLKAIELAGPVIFNYSILEGQRDNILQKGLVFQIPFKQERPTGDYVLDIARNTKRNNIVQAIAEEGIRNKRIVAVLAERRMHVRILQNRLRHLKCEVLSGEIKGKDRLPIVERLRSRKLQAVVGSRVFFKGLDIPQLDMMIDATGRPDKNSAVQRFGRGVRKADKRDLIYVDIADEGGGNRGRNWSDAATDRAQAWKKIGIPVQRLNPGEIPPCN